MHAESMASNSRQQSALTTLDERFVGMRFSTREQFDGAEIIAVALGVA